MVHPEQNQPIARPEEFLEALAAAWRRLGADPGPIILAASGGADSTALVVGSGLLARRLGAAFTVACLDHGLRPEAPAEVERVAQLARRLGLPFATRQLALGSGPGLEERAREARYGALEELRLGLGAAWVATAHTASDQAETLLMRLGRGSALKGAAGILERRGSLVRPLLFATRAQVRAFLEDQRESWVEDPMNADPAFLRVRVREQVVPALEAAFDAGVTTRLARFAALAAEDDLALAALADERWPAVSLSDGNLSAAALVEAPRPFARRWLARYLTERGVPLDFTLLNDALNAVAAGRTQTLPGDRVLRTRAGVVRVEPAPPRAPRG